MWLELWKLRKIKVKATNKYKKIPKLQERKHTEGNDEFYCHKDDDRI